MDDQGLDLSQVLADQEMSGLSGNIGSLGPAAGTSGPPPTAVPPGGMPVPPNPISSIGDYLDNAGQVYADAVGAPSFRAAMVNDPLYKLSKGYIDNASKVFGGPGLNDNTVTDPQTGKVYLGSAPPPAPPQPPMPAGATGPIVFPASDAGGNFAPTPRVVNVPATEIAKVSPTRQAELAGANAAEQQAVEGERGALEQQGEAELEAADVEAKGKGEEAKTAEKGAKETAARAQQRALMHEEQLRALATRQIDPMHYMHSRDTGQKVLDAIGSFLGGLGSYRTGHNDYADHLHDLIREDVEAQKANIERADNLYKYAYQVTGDEEEATRLAESLALKGAAMKTAAAVAGVQSPILRAKAAQGVAQLEAKRAQLAGKGVEQGIQMNSWQPAHQVVAGGAAPMTDDEEKRLVTMPDGRTVQAPSEKGAEEMRKTIEAHTSIKSLVDEARQLRQSHWAGVPGSFAHGRLEAIGNELVLKSREPGVRLGEGEMGILRSMQGDITSSAKHVIGQDTVDANLEHLGTAAVTNLQKFVGGQRLPQVRTGYAIDPATGRPFRTSELVGADYAPPKKTGGTPAGFQATK